MANNAETAGKYFETVGRRDLDQMVTFWKPGGKAYIHGIADVRVPDEYRVWFSNTFEAIPDYTMKSLEVIGDGDKVAVRWSATGHFTGTSQFEGFKANGARIEQEGIDLLTLEDGLIVTNHAYTNGMEIARQIGAMPPQGSMAEKLMVGAFNSKTSATEAIKRIRS